MRPTQELVNGDIAAGHAILDHAGGQIKTQQGNSFSYGKEKYKNLSIIAKIKEVKK